MIEPRIKNPVMFNQEAMQAMLTLGKTVEQSTIPPKTLALVHLRASQINGCSVCVDLSLRFNKAGDSTQRLFAVAAWREPPWFSYAERAPLALTEAVTRLSDRPDPVPDAIWNEAARFYNESEMATLVLWIAITNVWNRLNVATRQVAGEWAKSVQAKKVMESGAAAR